MSNDEIRTVEMVRRVRDELQAEMRDKGLTERLAAYRARAREVHEPLGLPVNRETKTDAT